VVAGVALDGFALDGVALDGAALDGAALDGAAAEVARAVGSAADRGGVRSAAAEEKEWPAVQPLASIAAVTRTPA
jgi:hypothetical protein